MSARYKRCDNIKSSLLRRIITVPRLPENALNSYTNGESENAGIYAIEIPNRMTYPEKILQANGVFNFGGIETTSSEVYISKIIIDDTIVFDHELSGTMLQSVFFQP